MITFALYTSVSVFRSA